jgi:two-component system sensor histidine kinase and response regulator WspE
MIRDLANALGKRASFTVIGGAVEVDRDILRKLEAPLNHLLRNCVDHGLETPEERRAAGKPEIGRITLEARHQAGTLAIEVRDDGRGIDAESLRRKTVDRKLLDASMAAELSNAELFEFLFLPGFSTASQVTEVSGRGVGLDVVRSMVQEVSGTVRVEAQVGQGAVFSLRLPVTLSVVRAALAEIAGELYAFPLSKLERIVRVSVEELEPVQGKLQFTLDGASVGLVRSEDVLDLSGATPIEDCLSVVVIRKDHYLCGVVVDRFIGEQDLVVRPLDPRLGKVPQISSAAITEEGDVLLIVDVEDLLHSVQQLLGEGRLRGMTSLVTHDRKARPRVLVVDDSITVREVERQLLVAEGYDVDVAIDGQDGWHALRSGSYDLLVSDIDMPRMSGLELIKAARQDSRFEHLPIIIVSYKDREEDRLRGFEVGANAYLTKGSFHDNSFVRTVSDLIGAID